MTDHGLAQVDARHRITLPASSAPYYRVEEAEDGTITLTPFTVTYDTYQEP